LTDHVVCDYSAFVNENECDFQFHHSPSSGVDFLSSGAAVEGGMSAAPQAAGRPVSAGDCRCLCGSLLARLVRDGVELRCRRCKRTVVVPLSPGLHGNRAQGVERIPIGGGG
jgi:hypothetical protein